VRCQRTRTPASMRRCGWTSSTAPDASDSDQRQDQGEGETCNDSTQQEPLAPPS
jgi:hypothetical protein